MTGEQAPSPMKRKHSSRSVSGEQQHSRSRSTLLGPGGREAARTRARAQLGCSLGCAPRRSLWRPSSKAPRLQQQSPCKLCLPLLRSQLACGYQPPSQLPGYGVQRAVPSAPRGRTGGWGMMRGRQGGHPLSKCQEEVGGTGTRQPQRKMPNRSGGDLSMDTLLFL